MKEILDLDSYEQQEQITYAHTRQQRVIIHISEATSGKKGYYCIGCSKELQARKGDIYMHHFAHDPADIKKNGHCSYNDETYRHQLAKDILQNLKSIKVPDICKYPPAEMQGETYLLKESYWVNAHTVQQEIQFYEDEAGNIQYGQKIDFTATSKKHLLIQPDIAFFDETGKPILLIELVATHRITSEKLLKIRRLGIDTVQVSIPKSAPEAIKNSFSNPQKTKWVYNNEQEQADYFSISKGSYPRVSFIDEWQRALIQSIETAKCTKIRIINLIRTIEKCLGAESYRIAEQAIRREISRVEENTARQRKQYDDSINSRRSELDATYNEIETKLRNEFSDRSSKMADDIRTGIDLKTAALDRTFRQITANHQAEINQLDDAETVHRNRWNSIQSKHEKAIRAEFSNIETNLRHEIQQVEAITESSGEQMRIIQEQHQTNSQAEIARETANIEFETKNIDLQTADVESLFSSASHEIHNELDEIIRFQKRNYELFEQKYKNNLSKSSNFKGIISNRISHTRGINTQLDREWKQLQKSIESDDSKVFEIGARKIIETRKQTINGTIEQKRRTVEREQKEFDNVCNRDRRQLNEIKQKQIAVETERDKLERDFSNIERKRAAIEMARNREQATFDKNIISREQRAIDDACEQTQNQLNEVEREQIVLKAAGDKLASDFSNTIDSIERKRAATEASRSREQESIVRNSDHINELRTFENQEPAHFASNSARRTELLAKIEVLERDTSEFIALRDQLHLAIQEGDGSLYPRLQSRIEDVVAALHHIFHIAAKRKSIRRIRKAQEAFECRTYKKWS
jgi:hypothetical protein